MCGIAGYIGKSPPRPNDLKQTSEVLKHRGPNFEGFYSHKFRDNNVDLVHRRLSIIDLDDRSNQPFSYEGTVLVFNGEIYNYKEIRQQLRELGHVFKTFGDTEVLAHALHQWGQNALEKLEGMWAFAWYDEATGTLLLSRDRFGEKPLYIWSKNNGLYFASETRALAAIANDSLKVNENHLLRNLVNGYRSLYKTNETFFLEVEELSPSTCLKIDTNGNVTTLAGSGSEGSNDGNSTQASFNLPFYLIMDSTGNIFLSDYGNHTVRKIDTNGNVTTIAGSAGIEGSDNGNRTSARFKKPTGLAFDSKGNILVSDYGNHLIRKIDTVGNVSTIAGTANVSGSDPASKSLRISSELGSTTTILFSSLIAT